MYCHIFLDFVGMENIFFLLGITCQYQTEQNRARHKMKKPQKKSLRLD